MFPQEEAPKILQQRSLKISRKLKSEKRFVILAKGSLYLYMAARVRDIFNLKCEILYWCYIYREDQDNKVVDTLINTSMHYRINPCSFTRKRLLEDFWRFSEYHVCFIIDL